ncbi:calmodulin-related protein 97A-like [Halichondria panicea]|uniref:calmodulin-related protein 97A-like n=1 Tax=Halichondria panicea TaxID=6063 RepID=UPI00312B4222
MAELEETDHVSLEHIGLLDEGEFHEAFLVFSSGGTEMSTANSTLLPFLRSIGVRVGSNHSIVLEIKRAADTSHKNLIREGKLSEIVFRHLPSLKSDWPSHGDALKAFQVFDSEGVGFIKVTMLKRFLVQAQLDVEESVLERLIRDNCTIDGDDLINYEEFIENISQKNEWSGHSAL